MLLSLKEVKVAQTHHIKLSLDGRAVTKKGGETEVCVGMVSRNHPYISTSDRNLRTIAVWQGGDDEKDSRSNLENLVRDLQSLEARGFDVRGGKVVGEAWATDRGLGIPTDVIWVADLKDVDEGLDPDTRNGLACQIEKSDRQAFLAKQNVICLQDIMALLGTKASRITYATARLS